MDDKYTDAELTELLMHIAALIRGVSPQDLSDEVMARIHEAIRSRGL